MRSGFGPQCVNETVISFQALPLSVIFTVRITERKKRIIDQAGTSLTNLPQMRPKCDSNTKKKDPPESILDPFILHPPDM